MKTYFSTKSIILAAIATLITSLPSSASEIINCKRISLEAGSLKKTRVEFFYPTNLIIQTSNEPAICVGCKAYKRATLNGQYHGSVRKNKNNGRLSIVFSMPKEIGSNTTGLYFDRFSNGKSQLRLDKPTLGLAKYTCEEQDETSSTETNSKYARPDDVQEIVLTSPTSDVWINNETGEAMMKSGSKWFYRIIDDIKAGQSIQIGILSFDEKPNTDTISNDDFNTFSVDAAVTVDGGVEALKANISDVMKYLPSTRWYVLHMRSEDGSTAKFRLRVKD